MMSSPNTNTTVVISDPTCRDIDHTLTICALVLLPILLMFTIATWQSVYGKLAYVVLYVVSLLVINSLFENNANGLLHEFASANINSLALRLLPLGGAVVVVLASFLWELGNWIAPFVVFVFILIKYNLMMISITSGVIACLVCILMRSDRFKYLLRTLVLVVGNMLAFCVLFTGWFNQTIDTGCQEKRNMLVVCNETCKVCTDNLPFTLGLYVVPVVIEVAAIVSAIIVNAWYNRKKKLKTKSKSKKKSKSKPKVEAILPEYHIDSSVYDGVEMYDVDLKD